MESRAGGRTHRRSISYNYQEWCLREVGSPAGRERQRRGRGDARQKGRRACGMSIPWGTCILAHPGGGPALVGGSGGAPSGSGSLCSPGTQASVHAGRLRKFQESGYTVGKECRVNSLGQG